MVAMRELRFASTLFLMLVTFKGSVTSFTPTFSKSSLAGSSAFGSPRAVIGSFRYDRTKLRSTVDRVEADLRKQEAAKGALEKLLDKQRTEVRETERLLRRFSASGELEGPDGDEEISSTRSSAIAASILSGFDYGFVSRSEGARSNLIGGFSLPGVNSTGAQFEGYGPPANIFKLGAEQFMRNLNAIRGEYNDEVDVKLTPKQIEMRKKLKQLTLNVTAVWEREEAAGPIRAPWLIKIPYIVLCYFLDYVFEGRYVPSRFFFLETVARMPYFSYITMLHLYETLGFWRRSSDIKRVHFAEEWNEFHHLLIMESLGGDQEWWVRFLAQHSALAYYVVLNILWALSPTLAYKFSELLETHAVNTYGQLLDENEELLNELPPSLAAVEYYSFGASDPFFGEYQTSALANGEETRQPGDKMRSLYDVFSAIREDEGDHVGTMKACLDPKVAVASPSLEKKILTGIALVAAFGYFVSTGDFGGDVTDVSDLVDGMSNVIGGTTESGDVLDGVGDAVGGAAEGGRAFNPIVDSFLGAIAAFAQKFANDEEEGDVVGVGTDLFEAGGAGVLLQQLKKIVVEILEAIGLLSL